MSVSVLDHALAGHVLTRLRDTSTPPEMFRVLARRLTYVLLAEATGKLKVRAQSVTTPLEEMQGSALDTPLVLIPVLRAGLGMLEAALELLPEASVGYVGLKRDEQTAIASSYYCNLPPMTGATALLLDPMLATGGSAESAVQQLYEGGVAHAILVCIVAAPEGVDRLQAAYPGLEIVAAALDRQLNDKKYILPGLGDFGDRLYGTT